MKKVKALGVSEQNDIQLISEVMEDFVSKFGSLSTAAKIDLAARLKPIAKACDTIDKSVRDQVKADLAHKDGTLFGFMFKAVLKLVPTHRLNQSKLKEERPGIHAQYDENVTDERVSFELR